MTPLKCQNEQNMPIILLQGKTAIHLKAVLVLRVKIVSGCNIRNGGNVHYNTHTRSLLLFHLPGPKPCGRKKYLHNKVGTVMEVFPRLFT